jgi:hypothetical protein
MDDMTIEQFCDFHGASPVRRWWAMENCKTMQEVWETAQPLWLIWIATRLGVLSDRELRLFAVWCARQVQHLMTDPLSVAAVADRYANGEVTDSDLDAARNAAWYARIAAWVAARDEYAAGCAAAAAQADWLRTNCTPRFTRAAGKEEVTT